MSTGELTGIVLTLDRCASNDEGNQVKVIAQTSDRDGYAVAQSALFWSLSGRGRLDPSASITDTNGRASTFIAIEIGAIAERVVLRCVDPETGVEAHTVIAVS